MSHMDFQGKNKLCLTLTLVVFEFVNKSLLLTLMTGLTLTLVVFEFCLYLLPLVHRHSLTLTLVVFEFSNIYRLSAVVPV